MSNQTPDAALTRDNIKKQIKSVDSKRKGKNSDGKTESNKLYKWNLDYSAAILSRFKEKATTMKREDYRSIFSTSVTFGDMEKFEPGIWYNNMNSSAWKDYNPI